MSNKVTKFDQAAIVANRVLTELGVNVRDLDKSQRETLVTTLMTEMGTGRNNAGTYISRLRKLDKQADGAVVPDNKTSTVVSVAPDKKLRKRANDAGYRARVKAKAAGATPEEVVEAGELAKAAVLAA